jgi:8-oxo-dGTP diphosphatase
MKKMFIAVAYVIVQDGKILLTRSKGKRAFYLPGGKPEAGESDPQTLVREVREELSLTLDPRTITHIGTFEAQAYGEPEGVFVQLRCYSGTHTGTPTPHAEIEEMRYFSFEQYLAEPETAPAVRMLFEPIEKNSR